MGWLEFLTAILTPSSIQTGRGATHQNPASPTQSEDVLFWGERTPQSRQIIREQVYEVAEHIFKDGVDFDESCSNWVVFPKYNLPYAWKGIARSTKMMVVFPTRYPEIPPIGFYLKGDLPVAPGGHFYDAAYHEAAKSPLQQGWKWYCVYVNPGSWQPSHRDWRRGDNLYTYLTLIKEALSNNSE